MFQPWSPSQEGGSRDHLVRQYFYAGHKYKTILQFLRSVHGFTLSIRQLKRSHLLVSRLIRVSYQKYLLSSVLEFSKGVLEQVFEEFEDAELERQSKLLTHPI